MTIRKVTTSVLSGALLLTFSTAGTGQPRTSSELQFALRAMPLGEALRQVAKQSGRNLAVDDRLVSGRSAPPLVGNFSPEQAIRRLIAGSGLTVQVEEGTIFVVSAHRQAKTVPEAGEIVVTGTHVRGAPPTSPVISINRRQIEQAAPSSVEELMEKLPQNVSAGVDQENFGVIGAGSDITEHGSGLNLRGLGQRATLVLANGRRLAPSGLGSFVDVSLLPVTALERVEVLTDGASAIYGSDAVGGVVNFILRKDFDGVEPLVQLSTTTRGGGRQILAGIAAGRTWSTGRALVSYEFRKEQPIKAGQRNFTINLPKTWYLLPEEKRQSAYGTARQDFADNLSLDVTGIYSARRTSRSFFSAGAIPVDVAARSRALGGTAALQFRTGSWLLEGSSSYFRTRTRNLQLQGGALFNRMNTQNSFVEFAVKADGTLAHLPGGPIKVALGGASRREVYESVFATSVNLPRPVDGRRTVRAAYGEIIIPAFSETNRRPGLERLTISAAARREDYGRIGSSLNPKVGLLWSPAAGLAVRSSYGTSFRAPLLSETSSYYNVFILPAPFFYQNPAAAPAGPAAALIGNNPEVRPERSKSLSLGVDVTPQQVAGLRLSANYYAIRFKDRIALPSQNTAVVGDPRFDAIVSLDPDDALLASLFAGANQILDFSGPGFTDGDADPSEILALLDARIANTAETRTRGLDLLLTYAFGAGTNRFNVDLNANKVFAFNDKLTRSSPWIRTLNTPFHAVDWRARAGFSWSRGPVSTSAALNYTAPYRDERGERDQKVRAFTTLDVSISLDGARTEIAALHALHFGLHVKNMFDAAPPKLLLEPGYTRGLGFDPVNATGRGRIVGFQVRGVL